jgi:hypothetical protein
MRFLVVSFVWVFVCCLLFVYFSYVPVLLSLALWMLRQHISSKEFIIIIIIIIIISFMQGIYTRISETNYVPREYSVAALLLLFMVLISLVSVLNLLYFYISTFRSVCVCVQCPIWLFSVVPWLLVFLAILLTYFLNDFEIIIIIIISSIIIIYSFYAEYIQLYEPTLKKTCFQYT